MTELKKYHDIIDELKCCVIVPSYNNDRTLESVLNKIKIYTSNIIVVNDGSTDDTRNILNGFTDLKIIHFDSNQGKGSALLAGFKKASELGYEYAITIDSDGQHFPEDIPSFIEMIIECPGSLIVGDRNMEQAGIPGKSSFGHKFSNFWYAVETGIKLPDTQSGYRLYPLKALNKINFYTKKFEFEIEVLVRANWHDIPVMSVPVSVKYFPKVERVSHFRPFKDFARISILNTILVIIALLWIKPLFVFKSLNKENIKKFVKEQILKNTESNIRLSFAIALGVFCGIVPIWGWQMIVAVSLAHFFKLNKIIVLTSSNISIPPMMPFILYLSYITGGYILGNPNGIKNFENLISINFLKYELVQYVIGSFAFALIAAGGFFIISYLIFMIFRKNYR
jgi:glycosyltransferase involved in cell wall biosynthesis